MRGALLKAPRDFRALILLTACLAFFVNRGPYRAIRFSTTGDFATVYAAARCWLHGADPYEREALKRELAEARAPADIQRDQDINPSVYLPAAMPWAATVAWLPWSAANTVWCFLSLLLFGWSISKLLGHSGLAVHRKWIAASALLLFSPTYVGVYDGNPGVIAISLIVVSICLALENAVLPSGITLGVAICFKPQLAICALSVFVLAKRWKPILVTGAVAAISLAIGVFVLSAFGDRGLWWETEQRNISVSFRRGGQSDPAPDSTVAWQFLNAQTLSSYFSSDRHIYDAVVWIGAALLMLLYVATRGRQEARPIWRDIAFCAAMTLVLTYHRYYDAQLLTLLLPFVVLLWRSEKRWSVLLIGACLGILAFPIQSLFARTLGEAATVASLKQLLLLRIQPAALLFLLIVVTFCCRGLELEPNLRSGPPVEIGI